MLKAKQGFCWQKPYAFQAEQIDRMFKMITKQLDLEIFTVKNINRTSVYEHLLALVNNSHYFGIAKYENPTADDYQRITVIDAEGLTEEIKRRNRGGVIGTVRLLPDGIDSADTVIHFAHKDASNNDPVTNPALWQYFIQAVEEYFAQLMGVQHASPDKDLTPVDAIPDMTDRKKILDQACIEWASRQNGGYIGRYTREDFLEDFQEKTGKLITKEEFRRALEDAQRRGIIVKIKGRLRPKISP